MKKLVFLLIAILGFIPFLYSQSVKPTTVYIVRHAEKDLTDSKNPDPVLSMEGEERAKALAVKLKKEKFAAVFSTKYKRTTQTGSVIAKNSKVAIEFYNPTDPKSLTNLIKTKYQGKKVLVIGHSNTVLELVEAFGVSRPIGALTDRDYDFLFKVKVNQEGYASIMTQYYGKSTHNQ